ncbi:MAG TPA: dockerin type I domain-containing protein [Tepidisphaeraceae bacterium]|nr:dockerin type I domain-containing protein [Tepidisphaeraceae bacterium]
MAMGVEKRRRVRAECLEPRCLLSAIIADAYDVVHDPPATLTGFTAVMNATTTYPLSDCPQFSSNPSAPTTIYLDFIGDTTQTWGSFSPGTTPAYDCDGDPTTFSSTELANIAAIWEQVADTYSPFNVNVTTINPGNINNPNLEVVIGGSGAWTGATYGGIAYVGSFAGTAGIYGANKNKVFVFPDHLGSGTPKYVADDSEHEVGHAFGLSHQSVWTQSGTTWTLKAEYNTGTSAAGPIMGNPLSDTRALWWDGTADYALSGGIPFIQDDLSIITSAANGFGYAPDDYGNTIATAYPLSGTNSFSANGVIGTNSDADFFSFSIFSGSATLSVQPGAPLSDQHPTLNANLQLFNSSGTLIATGTQSTLAKSITTTLSAGTYYAEVSGDGTYGDLGDYTLSISSTAPSWIGAGTNGTYALSFPTTGPSLAISAGTVSFSADAGLYLPNVNVSVASGADLELQSTQNLSKLQLSGVAVVDIVQGSQSALNVGSLQMSSNSILNLTNNSLQINGGNLSTVKNLVSAAYDDGEWNKPGITSSTAANSATYGVGYSSAVVGNAIVVKYARYGDINLDGVVNAVDFDLFKANENQTNPTWQDGDFNYDGKVTSDDLLRLSFSLALQGVEPTFQV